MSWAGIASNQCVSLNNLRDAIANNIFIAKTAVPAGTKQITKTEALAYVDIQTAPLASKASNQLVVKNNLNATVYTYNRYDLNLTTCVPTNPQPVWSNYNIPYGSYTINGLYVYQIVPATHSTFTYEITSFTPYTCTPLTQYTYQTSDVNPTTCALSNTIQWWSYNNYSNGYYYINGPGTLYSLSSATHTNYSNQITSVEGGTCSGATLYYYKLYRIDPCNCSQTFIIVVRSNTYYANGYYNVVTSQPDYVYLESTTPQSYYPSFSVQSTASSCTPVYCKTYYFRNSNLTLSQTFYFTSCSGLSSQIIVPANDTYTSCVSSSSIPGVGNRGDYPYTYDEQCC